MINNMKAGLTTRIAIFVVMVMILLGFLLSPSIAHDELSPPHQNWSFDQVFGVFDRAAAQRGFQVFKQVCSACHNIKHVRYEKLKALGFSEAEVKAVARTHDVASLDDDGNPITIPAKSSDYFVGPYANTKAARASNNGAAPPDLSLMVKARHRGADYVFALLTSFRDPPPDIKIMDGMHYNPYFPGHQIAMAAPLSDDLVSYADGTKATVSQMAHDVVTFLAWTAEPELESRHRMGVKILIFLSIFTAMLYAVMCRTWKHVKNYEMKGGKPDDSSHRS